MNLRLRVLLDQSAPVWFVKILAQAASVSREDIEVYEPNAERVVLSCAIIPTLLLQRNSFHPFTNTLLLEALDTCRPPPSGEDSRRVFLTQGAPRGPAARHCVNEAELLEIAEQRNGFLRVTIDTMDWMRQIALFRDAEIVLSNASDPVYNSLFGSHRVRFGSLGFTSLYPSQAGTLRGFRNAYFTLGTESTARYSVDPEAFSSFLNSLCE
jgi:capsular polysaccharide biosynthesis protein